MQEPGIDATLRALGGRSRYQLLQLLVINMGVWGAAFQLLDNIFIGRKVTWQQCATPENGTGSDSVPASLQHVDWSSADHVTYGPCEITVTTDDHRNQTFPCLFGYQYDYARELSFRTEFDLVCGRSLLADLLQTIVIMGQGCGAFVASFLSDRYGRKRILVWSQLGLLVVGLSIGLAPSYPLLACLKFAVGCLQQGVMTGKATMSIELFPSEFRSMTSLMMAMMWMSGTCFMAVTAYVLQEHSWRCLQCVLSSVSLLALLQMWYVDESMRWLLANGKKEAAIRVLHRAARINRQDVTLVMTALCGDVISHDVSGGLDLSPVMTTLPELPPTPLLGSSSGSGNNSTSKRQKLRRRSKAFDEPHHHHNENDDDDANDWEMVGGPGDSAGDPEEEPVLRAEGGGQQAPGPVASGVTARELVAEQKPDQRMTLLPVLRHHRRLRVYTALLWATWFTCTFSAFSLYVMSTSLHGNRFLNFFLTASMKLPAGLLFFCMVDRAGRKAGIQTFFILAAFGQLTSALFRTFEDNSLFAVLSVPASMIGSMGATGIFGALFLFTPELYPTNIRQQALGYASLAGRLGGMVAPFMIPLSEMFVWAPGLLSGSMCLGVIFLFRFLPETRGRELPQTLEDIDKWDRTHEAPRETERSWIFCCIDVAGFVLRFVRKMGYSVYAQGVRLGQGLLPKENKDSGVLTV